MGSCGRRRCGWSLAGYAAALTAAGIPVDEHLLVPASAWHRTEGAAGMRALLAAGERPDAVSCRNDTLALGAPRTLHEAGCASPATSPPPAFDGIEDGRFSVPTLTTTAPGKERLAQIAVDVLAARLNGPTARRPGSGWPTTSCAGARAPDGSGGGHRRSVHTCSSRSWLSAARGRDRHCTMEPPHGA